jgi:hypothetical protein
MSKKAAHFISKLSTDPKKAEHFKKDPDAAMAGEDLSPEDKAVLRTKDSEKIRKHLGDDAPPGCVIFDRG